MRTFPLLTMTAALLWALPAQAAPPATPAQAQALIQEELLYPRQALYYLPAQVEIRGRKNLESLLDTLKSHGILGHRQENGVARIDPQGSSHELVVADMDIHYRLRGVNLVLGQWEIAITTVRTEGDGVVAEGEARLTRPTPVYEQIRPMLQQEADGKRYAPRRLLRWHLRETTPGAMEITEETP